MTSDKQPKVSWLPLIILSAAQFLMLLDSTVMNVSISQLVIDLHTEITKIQAAITAYALVMAAFMMVGGKIGDIIGRKKIFGIGLLIYGMGSGITSISPNIGWLMFGWSFLEGIGAALILPALAALLAENYEGKKRAVAYGVIGAVSGLAIALGPLIGGYFTTYLSWRYVFAGEVLVALGIIASMKLIKTKDITKNVGFDYLGAVLSACGLGLLVYGILQISEWGFIEPRNSPITPFGFSLVPFLMIAGMLLLFFLYLWEEKQEKQNKPVLFKVTLLKNPPLKAGLLANMFQYLVIAGTFFVLPLYLQIVLGFDALKTGFTMLPISIALILTSIGGTRLVSRFSQRTIVQWGMGIMFLGIIIMLWSLNYDMKGTGFTLSLFLGGAGLGLVNSQLGNVIQSAVEESDRSEAGGLQYTLQNLGTSLGTALAGTIIIVGLLNGFLNTINNNPAISKNISSELSVQLQTGIQFVSSADAQKAAEKAGIDPQQTQLLVQAYEEAELKALREALGCLALTALIGLLFTGNLPKKLLIEHKK